MPLYLASFFAFAVLVDGQPAEPDIGKKLDNKWAVDERSAANAAAEPDIGKKLDAKWAEDDRKAANSAYKDATQKAVNSIGDIKNTITDTSWRNGASLLQDAGHISAALPFPPEAQVIGVTMYALGGLYKAFEPGPTQPSNQDILDAMDSSFAKLDKRLDEIDAAIDSAIAAVGRLQKTMSVLTMFVEAIYNDVHLKRDKMDQIDSVYEQSMSHLKDAVQERSHPKLMDDFKHYVTFQRSVLENELENSMSPSNIKYSLTAARDQTQGSTCTAALTYKSHVATRWKLYWIMVAGSLVANGGTGQVTRYTERLKQDLGDYLQAAKDLEIDLLIGLSDKELANCLDTVNAPSDWIQLIDESFHAVPGLRGTTGCPTGYSFYGTTLPQDDHEHGSQRQIECDRIVFMHRMRNVELAGFLWTNQFVPGCMVRRNENPFTRGKYSWEVLWSKQCDASCAGDTLEWYPLCVKKESQNVSSIVV